MKRLTLGLFVLIGVCALPMVASAQDAEGGSGGDVKTKFYNFDDMLIDGELKKPDGFVYGAVEQAKFERLLSLKKSFLPKIEETAKDDALK